MQATVHICGKMSKDNISIVETGCFIFYFMICSNMSKLYLQVYGIKFKILVYISQQEKCV